MKRRTLLASGLALLAAPIMGLSQPKVPTVGLLWNDTLKPSPYQATLLRALSEKGRVAGRTIRIQDRVSLEGYGGMSEGAAELARAKVDVIVAYGATATLAARKASAEIPIVMIVGADPVALGLATSLAQPTGNVTGVTTNLQELHAKRMQLLTQLVPGASRIGVLIASESGSAALGVKQIEKAAGLQKLEIHFAEVRTPEDLSPAFAGLSKSRVEAIYVTGSTMLAAHAPEVVALAAKHRLPAMYAQNRHLEAGGLVGYGPDTHHAFVLAAAYVDRILGGAKPRELAIEQMNKLELVINRRTAGALGLTIPAPILLRADRVID